MGINIWKYQLNAFKCDKLAKITLTHSPSQNLNKLRWFFSRFNHKLNFEKKLSKYFTRQVVIDDSLSKWLAKWVRLAHSVSSFVCCACVLLQVTEIGRAEWAGELRVKKPWPLPNLWQFGEEVTGATGLPWHLSELLESQASELWLIHLLTPQENQTQFLAENIIPDSFLVRFVPPKIA